MKLSAYSRLEREGSDVIETPFCNPKFFQYFLLCNQTLYLVCCLFMLLHFFDGTAFPASLLLSFTFDVVSLDDELWFFQLYLTSFLCFKPYQPCFFSVLLSLAFISVSVLG